MTRPDLWWEVRRDGFPFGIGAPLGHVTAPDYVTALTAAVKQYAGGVVVQVVRRTVVEKQLLSGENQRDRR